jgi:hypothetical protein
MPKEQFLRYIMVKTSKIVPNGEAANTNVIIFGLT